MIHYSQKYFPAPFKRRGEVAVAGNQTCLVGTAEHREIVDDRLSCCIGKCQLIGALPIAESYQKVFAGRDHAGANG